MRAWTQEDYLDFANRCLFPWQVKGAEIVPEYCPICHGGNHGDKYTFALNVEHGVYCCKRASCGMKGTVNQLAHLLAYTPLLIMAVTLGWQLDMAVSLHHSHMYRSSHFKSAIIHLWNARQR